MPTYLPSDQVGHPRASSGLVALQGVHKECMMLLVLRELDSLSEQSEISITKPAEAFRGHDWAVERFKSIKRGWTQMPGSWLSAEEKKTRADVLDSIVAFTVATWESGMKRKSSERSYARYLNLQDGFLMDLCLPLSQVLHSPTSTTPDVSLLSLLICSVFPDRMPAWMEIEKANLPGTTEAGEAGFRNASVASVRLEARDGGSESRFQLLRHRQCNAAHQIFHPPNILYIIVRLVIVVEQPSPVRDFDSNSAKADECSEPVTKAGQRAPLEQTIAATQHSDLQTLTPHVYAFQEAHCVVTTWLKDTVCRTKLEGVDIEDDILYQGHDSLQTIKVRFYDVVFRILRHDESKDVFRIQDFRSFGTNGFRESKN